MIVTKYHREQLWIHSACLYNSSYIQKYAAMMAENRERMHADKLNVDAAPAVSPHVSAIP